MDQAQQPEVFFGSDVEEATARGLDQLGLSRDEVEVEVLDDGSAGFLGFGGRPARVRLTRASSPTSQAPAPQPPTPQPKEKPQVEPEELDAELIARDALGDLLELLGFDDAEIHTRQAEPASDEEDAPLILDVYGPGVDALIGRRGKTLAGLQRIVRLMVGRRLVRWVNLVVDVDGYKQKREQSLRGLAERMAEEAVRSGRTVVLEPMPAYERRIIHVTLRDDSAVRTESVGSGNRRRVTIIPQ